MIATEGTEVSERVTKSDASSKSVVGTPVVPYAEGIKVISRLVER